MCALVPRGCCNRPHRLTGLYTTGIYLSWFWRLEAQDQGVSMDGCWWSPLLSSTLSFSLHLHLGKEAPKALTAIIGPHTKVKTTESMFQTVSFSGLFTAFKNNSYYIFLSFSFSLSCCLVMKSCLTLCDPVDCSPPGSSVRGISQARILECIATFFSRRASQARD